MNCRHKGEVRCTSHMEGCEWVGEQGRLKSHLDSDKGCGFVEVTCTNIGCKKKVRRNKLPHHQQQKCYYRTCECEYCKYKDKYWMITGKISKKVSIESHYSECPEFPLDCPNRCGVTGIRRRAVPDHRSSCPLEPLDCQFKDAGCNKEIVRKDMENHMTANQQEHMLLIFHSLQQSNEQMKQKLHATREELKTTNEKLENTTQKLKATNEKLQNTAQKLHAVAVGLNKIGAMLMFQVLHFSRKKRERRPWHSLPFTIAEKIRVLLAVHPSGIGRGQGSHVSVSLILKEVETKEEDMRLEYNVSVATKGQNRATRRQHRATSGHGFTKIKLCRRRANSTGVTCSDSFSLPSPGEVLQSEEQFLKIEEASSLLVNDSLTLTLRLLTHRHHYRH